MAKKSRLDIFYKFLEAQEKEYGLNKSKVEEAKNVMRKMQAHGKKIDILKALAHLGHIKKSQIPALKDAALELKKDPNIETVPESEAPEETDSIFTDLTIQPESTLGDGIENIISEAEQSTELKQNLTPKKIKFNKVSKKNPKFDEDRYEKVKQIGQGGMGTVDLYKDTNMENALVAVKKILAEKVTKTQEDRFVKEQKAGIKLAGIAQVCRALDRGRDKENNLRLVSEYVLGRELRDIYDDVIENGKTRKYPLSLILGYLADIARGTHKAHEKGILHRDLKPPNVMITEDGEVKIMDYGLAKILDEKEISKKLKIKGKKGREKIEGLENASIEGESVTMDNVSMGTPPYMPPEQVMDAAKVDHKADIYSIGAMIYEILTGMPPHDWARNSDGSVNIQKTLLTILHKDILKPSEIEDKPYGDQIDADIEAIAMKAIAKNPRDRYKTAKDLADDIDRYLARQPVLARPRGLFERMGNFVRDRPVITGLSALLLAATIATVGVYQHSQTRTAKLEAKAEKEEKEKLALEKEKVDRQIKEAQIQLLKFKSRELKNEAATLVDAGQFDEAIKKYTAAVEITPTDYIARGGRAAAYYNKAASVDQSEKNKWLEKAKTDIELALSDNAPSASLRKLKALIYLGLDDFSKVRKIYEEAISLNKNNLELLAGKVDFHFLQNEYEEAESTCLRMLNINPDYVPAHVGLIGLYRATGDLDSAEDHARYLANTRKLPNAFLFLSETLYEQALKSKNLDLKLEYTQEAKENMQTALQVCERRLIPRAKKWALKIDKLYNLLKEK